MAAFDGGVMPAAGNQYIVNGFPYSGMGFGFNPGSGELDQTESGLNRPWPCCPTPRRRSGTRSPTPRAASRLIVPGGVNSDYTAPDYQDPLLAMAVPNPNISGGVIVPIPSLHRSDLIAYTNAQLGNVGHLAAGDVPAQLDR